LDRVVCTCTLSTHTCMCIMCVQNFVGTSICGFVDKKSRIGEVQCPWSGHLFIMYICTCI
jgi:hypothetical protein